MKIRRVGFIDEDFNIMAEVGNWHSARASVTRILLT
jgi:hypothetical protein